MTTVKLIGVRVPTSRGKRRLRRLGRMLSKHKDRSLMLIGRDSKVTYIMTRRMPTQVDDSAERNEKGELPVLHAYYFSFPLGITNTTLFVCNDFNVPFAQIKKQRDVIVKYEKDRLVFRTKSCTKCQKSER